MPHMVTDAHYVRMRLGEREIAEAMKARFDAVKRRSGVFCFVAHPHYDRLPDKKYLAIYEELIQHINRSRVKWWMLKQLRAWEEMFDQIRLGDVRGGEQELSLAVSGPEEAFRFGKVALAVRRADAGDARAQIDGEECPVLTGEGLVRVLIPRYGRLSVKLG